MSKIRASLIVLGVAISAIVNQQGAIAQPDPTIPPGTGSGSAQLSGSPARSALLVASPMTGRGRGQRMGASVLMGGETARRPAPSQVPAGRGAAPRAWVRRAVRYQ